MIDRSIVIIPSGAVIRISPTSTPAYAARAITSIHSLPRTHPCSFRWSRPRGICPESGRLSARTAPSGQTETADATEPARHPPAPARRPVRRGVYRPEGSRPDYRRGPRRGMLHRLRGRGLLPRPRCLRGIRRPGARRPRRPRDEGSDRHMLDTRPAGERASSDTSRPPPTSASRHWPVPRALLRSRPVRGERGPPHRLVDGVPNAAPGLYQGAGGYVHIASESAGVIEGSYQVALKRAPSTSLSFPPEQVYWGSFRAPRHGEWARGR